MELDKNCDRAPPTSVGNSPPSGATGWSRWPCVASHWRGRRPEGPAAFRSSWRADSGDSSPRCLPAAFGTCGGVIKTLQRGI